MKTLVVAFLFLASSLYGYTSYETLLALEKDIRCASLTDLIIDPRVCDEDRVIYILKLMDILDEYGMESESRVLMRVVEDLCAHKAECLEVYLLYISN